ncbi:hypothetical protein TRFO_31761 [Tritrichomonas foetus]|uniref:Uncharacterized protein n=1 Tax=Tritrichomonas foetus TaxID=1144522 RepID=A0A1J4JVX4_9EUKA|nr:hypothetical protein TRFO_31761 [Tritrichomonas foetus]|eukprot:OHT01437.1 hypothetical protein TRFO_31761 [Tritrichomonas foetus]
MRRSPSPNRTSSPRKGTSQSYLSESLFTLSHSGVDIKSRHKFLDSFSQQIVCRTSVEATRFTPDLPRVEIEGWISALQNYTKYLSALLREQEEVTAEEQLQILIDRAKSSPKREIPSNSPTRSKNTQTPRKSPHEDITTPKRSPYTVSTPQRSPSPKKSVGTGISPLAKSQNSRQSRGTVTTPVPNTDEAANERKSMLAKLIESSPKFISFNDPIESEYSEDEQKDTSTQTFLMSPAKSTPQRTPQRTPPSSSKRSRSPHSASKYYVITQVEEPDDDELISSDFVVDEVISHRK